MLVKVPIYQALNKPFLLFGGERELMIIVLLIPFLLIYLEPFAVFNWVAAISIWIILSTILRMMAKADPLMSKIYIRQLKYQKYYRAVASASA